MPCYVAFHIGLHCLQKYPFRGFHSLTELIIFIQANQEKSKPDDIMESTTDASDWKMEVERVLPQLKVTIRTDNKVVYLPLHLLLKEAI